jgi:hypothetical protein
VADHDSLTAHHPQLGLDRLDPGSERWPVRIGQLRVEDLLAPLPEPLREVVLPVLGRTPVLDTV